MRKGFKQVFEMRRWGPVTAADVRRERLARRAALVLAAAAAPLKPSGPNEAHAALAFLRAGRLQSVANWMAKELAAGQEGLRAAVLKDIKSQARGTTVSMFAALGRTAGAAFDGMARDCEDMLADLGGALNDHAARATGAHFGVEARPAAVELPLVMGAAIQDHFEKMCSDFLFRLKAAVRSGIAAGDDAAGLQRRIVGDAAPVKASEPVRAAGAELLVDIFDATQNAVFKVLQQAAVALAAAADEVDVPEDSGKRMGYVWVSAQDGAVCDTCEFYDGNKWDADKEPVDDGPELDVEPGQVHYGCRCALVPCDLDEDAPAGKFDDYLDQFTNEEQEEAFGKDNVESYRRGTASPSALMGQRTHAMSIDDFKAGEPDIKFDAGDFEEIGKRGAAAANERTAERRAAQ